MTESNLKIISAAQEIFNISNLNEKSLLSHKSKANLALIVNDLNKSLVFDNDSIFDKFNKNYILQNVVQISVTGPNHKKICHIKYSDGTVLSGQFSDDKFDGLVYLESQKKDLKYGMMRQDSKCKDYIEQTDGRKIDVNLHISAMQKSLSRSA